MTIAIGEVAQGAGVSVSAVRYYDQLGIIEVDERVGGKRRFSTETIGRVSFIKRCQEFGFTLDEIKDLLDDQARGWRSLVDTKLVDLSAQRARLDQMIEMLTEIRECGCETVGECPRLPAI